MTSLRFSLNLLLLNRSKNTDSGCNCWVKDCKPKSKSRNCKGGFCYPHGMSVGEAWIMDGYCNKYLRFEKNEFKLKFSRFRKCTCWKRKVKPCKTRRACAKAGGVCIPRTENTDATTILKQKCSRACICVKNQLIHKNLYG